MDSRHPTVINTADDRLSEKDLEQIEVRTQAIGSHIFEHLDRQQANLFERRWWDERLMQWAMSDEALKVELFRFVDVLPMLRTSDAVTEHLNEYLGQVRDRLPTSIRVALGVARRTPFTRSAVARAARLGAMDLARRFIAGTNAAEVLMVAKREREQLRAFTLDILGEAVTSEVEAQRYFDAYVGLIEQIAPTVNQWPEITQIDRGYSGLLPRMNLSIKLSALDSQFDAIDPAGVLARAGNRLRKLLRTARHHRAFINVDMESYDKKSLTLEVFQQILMEDEFREFADVGIVIQGYLRDSYQDLVQLIQWARERGTPVWVRLVKGAYWDYEVIHAQANGWPVPVYQQKWETDANFERLTRLLLANHEHLRPALGTHNIRSIAHGIATAQHLGLPSHAYELQMLYGMADAEKQTLVQMGHRLRIYMPYGQLIPGMAYLVRRLLENTSNDSFLRAGFVEHVPPEQLLLNPYDVPRAAEPGASKGASSSEPATDGQKSSNRGKGAGVAASSREKSSMNATVDDKLKATFANEPPIDFTVARNRQAMQEALADVRERLGNSYALVIGDEEITTDEQLECRDPGRIETIVGRVSTAERHHAEQAARAAHAALPAWRALPAQQRADYIERAAQRMRERLFELAAWEVYECAKGWREATADINEAIDFCRYYAAAAVALAEPRGADVPGEENRFEYFPRGVAAVISPWNFPLAILTGMTAAALATGNTVVMKPAEQASVIAAHLMEIFRDVGLPAGVLNYLPGRGEVAGATLVDHPDVALIAFTGSREVGLQINRRAAEISAQGIGFVKYVIAEMGGKNAIIVDADADLDEAVMGVVKSAFGYQGQKCSACSRVIVLESVYEQFLERIVEASRSLQIGHAEQPSTSVAPVIDAASREKIQRYIARGRQEGREVLSVDVPPELAEQGYYVGPHIFADVDPNASMAQEEIFGPVLAVIRARNLDEAIEIFNSTQYGLTGGMYSRSPQHLERARRELMVGNLYLNRTITGALVGRQPFGGFKLSGIGSKTGSEDYLLQFVLPRTITENTMRRGFAPS